MLKLPRRKIAADLGGVVTVGLNEPGAPIPTQGSGLAAVEGQAPYLAPPKFSTGARTSNELFLSSPFFIFSGKW